MKGIKKEIFFISDLGDIGNGIFECAYLIIRSDEADVPFCDNDIIAEAEKIVMLAEKNRFSDRTVFDGNQHSNKEWAAKPLKTAKPKKMKGMSMFFVGALFGVFILSIAALIYFFILR